MPLIRSLLAAALVLVALDATAATHRRALLIGINDYSASKLPRPSAPVPDRDWRNLNGSVNDVHILADMLVALYGFDRRDIVTLTDQEATRAAILQALERHLVAPAAKDDVLLFYFAGHGAQVFNSKSDERDKLDESIVPADSRLGVRDVRDKELRDPFNRILDRGARLTVVLDNCHSGSGARGLPTDAQARGIKPDLRDVADGRRFGPRPENRGALVLSAAEDDAEAWESRDNDGNMHGAFSWAWIRAMRDASTAEPAIETFLRAQARLRGEKPFQEPVIAGNADARLAPFLGGRADRRGDRTVVAVQTIAPGGTVVLNGGWANGLTVGSELAGGGARLKVTSLRGVVSSEARVISGGAVHPGALLEVAAWAAPPTTPLRVFVPLTDASAATIGEAGRTMAARAVERGVRWVADPTEVTPARVVLWNGANGGAVDAAPAGAPLFVEFPLPSAAAAKIAMDGVERVPRAEDADYVLVGRATKRGGVSYAWVRPGVTRGDRRKSGLPARTAWVHESAPALREALLRLRKIHAWHTIESPPGSRFAYRLDLRRTRDGQLPRERAVTGGEEYEPVLRVATMPLPKQLRPRYVYVFVIDSDGRSTLLFPPRNSGSVENRLPAGAPDTEIALGESSRFTVTKPYGVDTYFLLTTDEPLPSPWILEWDGVRGPPTEPLTPLEQLLLLTSSGTRSVRLVTPVTWSLERLTFESLPQK